MRILHWYYDFMNLYGDYGNMVVLKKHLEDQGIECVIDKKTVGDEVNLNDYQLIYMGPGTERNQKVVLHDLLKHKDELLNYIENDGLTLFTGNAMELLAKAIGEDEALGLLDFSVKHTSDRYTGDAIMNSEFGEVVGFINKCSIIEGNDEYPLFKYRFKDGGLKDNDFEGYHYKNAIGTQVIGPILVKNPNVMKALIKKIIELHCQGVCYQDIRYEYEEDSYNVTLQALKQR